MVLGFFCGLTNSFGVINLEEFWLITINIFYLVSISSQYEES